MRPLLLLYLSAVALWADGGAVQLRQKVGSLTITVFSTPTPLRVGKDDISVMVQKTADHSSILDAKIRVRLSNSEPGKIVTITAPATHDKATNKLLYAAEVNVPSPGDWQLTADIQANGETAEVAGKLNVFPAQPPVIAYWPYFILLPIVIALFFINRWLRRKQRAARWPGRPLPRSDR